MQELLHLFLRESINYSITLLEFMGLLCILIGSAETLVKLAKAIFNFNVVELKLNLANSLSFALEFILAAEILKTLIVTDLHQLLILSVILILRIVISFVLHFETKDAHKKID